MKKKSWFLAHGGIIRELKENTKKKRKVRISEYLDKSLQNIFVKTYVWHVNWKLQIAVSNWTSLESAIDDR